MPHLSPFAVVGQAAQVAVAALGGFILSELGFPAAWMSGSMVAVVLWGAAGLARPLPRPLADAAMLISGASMGAGITPEALSAMARYPASLALLALAVMAVTGGSALWLTRVAGWRRGDAVLASAPGALSTVLAIAADRKGDVGAIAVVQSMRLFFLIALLPSVVVALGGGAGALLPGAGRAMASPFGLAVVLIGGLCLGAIFERFRVAAPILLGATVASAALHATGAAPGVVPPPVAVGGLVLIGTFIGVRFRTLRWSAVRGLALGSVGSLAIGIGVATLFAALAALVPGVAFAPGGLEAMMVLALVLGLDPLFVGVHHLARFLGIALVLPLVIGRLGTPARSLDEKRPPSVD